MQLAFDPDNPNYEYITTVDRATEVLKELLKEKVLGVDIEGTGFDPYTETMLTVQIGTEDISYIFDARDIELGEIPEYKKLMESSAIVKIFQNGKFDYKWIKHFNKVNIANIYDTMLAEAVLQAGLGSGFYGLKGLALKYCDVDLDKNTVKSFIGMKHARFSEEQLKYGALDTLVLFPIFKKQIVALKKNEVFKVAKLEFAVTVVVAEMEYSGIYVDTKKWKEILAKIEDQKEEAKKEFYALIEPFYSHKQADLFGGFEPVININSQQQLLDLFNNKLGLHMESTGVAILEATDHPVVKVLMKYRKAEKLMSAFGDSFLNLINPVTKRVHPSFNQMGAATGRFSCNRPNLQQIPAGRTASFRECFNPIPGYKMVVSDYSSMEMRILADLSKDQRLMDAVIKGLDLHSYTASVMFGLEYNDDFKDNHPDKRFAAKAINFGLMYGMGAHSLARQINVTPEEGEEYMKKYFESYPSVGAFLDGMAKNAVKNGWSSTPAGRKRWYKIPEKSDPDYKKKIGRIERQAKNHPIQGTNADAIKFALIYVHERFKSGEFDGRITHTVHDEIVCEVREDQAEEFAQVLSDEMIRAAEIYVKNVPIASDPFVGDVWEH